MMAQIFCGSVFLAAKWLGDSFSAEPVPGET